MKYKVPTQQHTLNVKDNKSKRFFFGCMFSTLGPGTIIFRADDSKQTEQKQTAEERWREERRDADLHHHLWFVWRFQSKRDLVSLIGRPLECDA